VEPEEELPIQLAIMKSQRCYCVKAWSIVTVCYTAMDHHCTMLVANRELQFSVIFFPYFSIPSQVGSLFGKEYDSEV
jgi:hypothetical protein